MPREKRPATAEKPRSKKRPEALPPGPSRGIVWKFAWLDHDGPWPLHGIDATSHRQLLEKLGHFEKSTFEELSGPRGAKCIGIARLGDGAQRRLEELARDDCEGLWELHVDGRRRLWGIRDDQVMSVLWWDPQHTVCPSSKKRT